MNFTGHSLLGLLAGAIAALVVAGVAPTTLDALGLPLLVPAAVLVSVYLGAIYPDVDRSGSIPRQRLLPHLQAVAVGAVALLVALRWESFVDAGRALFGLVDLTTGPLVAGTGAALCAAGVAAFAVGPFLSLATGPHRTWTHSVAVNALLAGALAAAIWFALPLAGDDRLVLAALPFAFVLGVAVHNLADAVT